MHVLVVGGTGMLRGATMALAEEADVVSVVARRADRLGHLPKVNPLPLDYRDDERLAEALREAIDRYGPVELAVTWIHSVAPNALSTVVRELARPGVPFRLFHVRGSATKDPSQLPPPSVPLPETCRYHQVILGFVIEGNTSRWLTHEEISGGVLRAIRTGEPESIIGTVRPWSMRP